MIKYLIFDLDNTIYDYEKCDTLAKNKLINYINKNYNIEKKTLIEKFNYQKNIYQDTVYSHASSHNKFIQFKKLLETLKINIKDIQDIYDIYINEFNNNITLYPYFLDFLKLCNQKNIKLYVLTNNLCQEQIYRLKKLNILDYFTKVYTSEEIGIEKPDPKIFYYLLGDINCTNYEVGVIGDNYKYDINSTSNLNIYGFWFNSLGKLTINNNFMEFNSYKCLIIFFSNYYDKTKSFVKLSKFVGERYDLTQAGGGNISFKMLNIMFIKASGCSLSELEINRNYVGVNYKEINDKMKELYKIKSNDKNERENISEKIVNNSKIFLKQNKPSIETTLHTILKKYTLHLHPIQFNMISGLKNCYDILNNIFNNSEFCFINYFTPGIELALEILNKYKDENIIFLKNHGVIFTSNDIEELYKLVEYVTNLLEIYLKKENIFDKYKLVNNISSKFNKLFKKDYITYLSQDFFLVNLLLNNHSINSKTFFPDKLVYCHIDIIKINNINELQKNLNFFLLKYNSEPKIIIIDKNIYIISKNIKKCREIEEVFKSHVLCINNYKNDDLDYLDEQEINYLLNWDAEKFRTNK